MLYQNKDLGYQQSEKSYIHEVKKYALFDQDRSAHIFYEDRSVEISLRF